MLTGFPNNQIPASQLSPFTQKLMNFLYPLPNYGASRRDLQQLCGYVSIPINSAQGDVRIDQSLGPKHFIFARWSYKNRRIEISASARLQYPATPATPLLGSVSTPQIYNSFATSYNWVISPTLVNELRGGFSVVHRNATDSANSSTSRELLGLTSRPRRSARPYSPR